MHKTSSMFAIVLTILLTAQTSNAALLVNYGTTPNTTGRAVSGANTNSNGFTVFQAFDVDAQWSVITVGVDGWEALDPGNVNFIGTLFNDDGTGNAADTGTALGSTTHELDDMPGSSSWSDSPLNITLGPGRYWYRLSAGDADHNSALFLGDMPGPGSYSIRGSDGSRFDAPSVAFRIEGTVVPEPGSVCLLSGLLVLGLARRRRSH